jgi:methylated-DNA-[protein]-cysteine S-methyltransferase
MAYFQFDFPIGPLTIVSSNHGISAIHFGKIEFEDGMHSAEPDQLIWQCAIQLHEYFSGKRKAFDVPLDPQGTGFQKSVWNELMKIPFGKTVSYLDIAKSLGDPGKIRAVGGANGKNPIAIIVPCHRVIGSDGSLTGYSGGMDKKRWLLQFEGTIPGELFEFRY